MFEPDGIDNLSTPDLNRISIEEVLLDTDADVVHSSLESGHRNTTNIKIFAALVLVGLLVISGQLINLQIGRGDDYSAAAENNRVRTIRKFAPRGLITDRYGEPLVRNIPSFELVAIPIDLPKDNEARTALFSAAGQVIGISAQEIAEKLNSASANSIEPFLIKQSLSQDEALKLEGLVQNTPGFQIQSTPIREYLNGPAFSNILGFTGKLTQEEWEQKRAQKYFFNDILGKTGVELVFEDTLRGRHGGTEVEVDASGKIVKKIREVEPQTGHDVTLTVDAGLQLFIYNALQEMLAARPASLGAAAVASNPKTGEILALVTLPGFDNNLFAKGIKTREYNALVSNKAKPMLNRPLAGLYPPGSTIKPLIAAAALQEGVITRQTKINDEGVITVGSFNFYGWKREGLGVMDVISAIAWSSDPFFYVVGGGHEAYGISGLGVDRLVAYLQKFNFGQPSGISLPGEESGFVPSQAWKKQRFAGTDEQNWYLGNTYHLSIGQGYFLVTPLQLNMYIAALANDGKMMKPVIAATESPQLLREVGIEQKNLEIAQAGMREVILSGTSQSLKSLPVSAAGKTGTAQFDASDLSRTHAWYTAYAPYEDPEIAITVIVEGGGEGSSTSVPIVREALRWYAEHRLAD